MEEKLKKITDVLHQLIGLHRQLLDLIRVERAHLSEANLHDIEKVTQQKHLLVEEIHRVEVHRMQALAEFAVESKKPIKELSLSGLILMIQGEFPQISQQLSSMKNTLLVLSQRISEHNKENAALIERSLANIDAMKTNLFLAEKPHSETYSQTGQKISSSPVHRILSQEV